MNLQATEQLPAGCSESQRGEVEAALVEKARRFDPDRAVVDAHENALVATEEEAARSKPALTLHDNADGTTSGHFTVPRTAAAFLRKILDSMTAPRRMRERRESFDWRHRRGLAEAQPIALGLRHETCAAHGCQRAYAWCELHHREPRSHGRRTDLQQAVPPCHRHHQRIHDHTYHHTRLPDGTIRFTRRCWARNARAPGHQMTGSLCRACAWCARGELNPHALSGTRT